MQDFSCRYCTGAASGCVLWKDVFLNILQYLRKYWQRIFNVHREYSQRIPDVIFDVLYSMLYSMLYSVGLFFIIFVSDGKFDNSMGVIKRTDWNLPRI